MIVRGRRSRRGRCGRVVTETDSSMPRSAVSSMRDSVVLPAPDGDDSTSIRPRRAIRLAFAPSRAIALLQVLHLLAELLDHGLELQPDIGQFDVVGFGAQRIGFAVELLGQEIELAADRRRRRRSASCACATCAASRSSSSRMSALVASRIASWCSRSASKRCGCFEQRGDLLGEPRLDRLGLAAGRGLGARGQRGDFVEAAPSARVRAPRPRAGASRRGRSGPRRSPRHRRLGGAPLLLALLGLADLDHALEREDAVERRRRARRPCRTGPAAWPAPPSSTGSLMRTTGAAPSRSTVRVANTMPRDKRLGARARAPAPRSHPSPAAAAA